MDYLPIYLTIAAVFTQNSLCRPEFSSYHHYDTLGFGHQQYHQVPQTVPIIRHDGYLADTHEVAAAKEAHLAALAAHSTLKSQEDKAYNTIHEQEHVKPYHGPIAVSVVLPNGYLADTSEVAVAKLHHLGALAQAKANKYYSGHEEYGYGGAYGYSGSHKGYGIPVILPNGHIADTLEVAAAKSAHLLAVAKAKADKYYSGQGEGYGGAYGYSGSYRGYGVPVILPNGHIADTHEVAAAKQAHLLAVAHAKAEQDHTNYHDDSDIIYQEYEPHYTAHHEQSYSPLFEPHQVLYHQPLYKAHEVPQSSTGYWFFG